LFNDFFLFFLLEDSSTMRTFCIGCFDESITDFTCKHLFIVFLCLCTDGRNFAIFHALEDDFYAHIIAFERNFGLYCMFKS
tara:strand:- start:491 stop:733 length:243 start_codon:yes stop_codon:yes gene_type:complete